jgi:hypothetical protein
LHFTAAPLTLAILDPRTIWPAQQGAELLNDDDAYSEHGSEAEQDDASITASSTAAAAARRRQKDSKQKQQQQQQQLRSLGEFAELYEVQLVVVLMIAADLLLCALELLLRRHSGSRAGLLLFSEVRV